MNASTTGAVLLIQSALRRLNKGLDLPCEKVGKLLAALPHSGYPIPLAGKGEQSYARRRVLRMALVFGCRTHGNWLCQRCYPTHYRENRHFCHAVFCLSIAFTLRRKIVPKQTNFVSPQFSSVYRLDSELHSRLP